MLVNDPPYSIAARPQFNFLDLTADIRFRNLTNAALNDPETYFS